MLVILTGIPGTGKTTVAKVALNKIENTSYDMINFGDVMFEIAKEGDIVAERDAMRKLNPEVQKEIQVLAAKKIGKMSRGENNFLLDTHCTISTPRGYLPGIPEYVLKELKPSLIVLVEANEDEIYKRRITDSTRKRDDESKEEIKLHQELNRSIAMSYSTLTGATIKIMKNPQGKLEDTGGKLAKILEI